jgi:hypothetical protein
VGVGQGPFIDHASSIGSEGPDPHPYRYSGRL